MKRSPELIALTREHHHALVLARRAIAGARDMSAARKLAASLADIFARELEPHFLVEERKLLPLLREAGAHEPVARTLDEHERLRALALAAGQGDLSGLEAFGLLLEAHVRFEERELFQLAEAVIPASALAAVAACAGAATARHVQSAVAK